MPGIERPSLSLGILVIGGSCRPPPLFTEEKIYSTYVTTESIFMPFLGCISEHTSPPPHPPHAEAMLKISSHAFVHL